MKQVVVSIYDRAAQLYSQPAFVQSLAVGIRSFTDEVKRVSTADRANPLADHPSDFELWSLSVFDPATGEFEADRRCVLRASEVGSAGASSV